jgi:hypothetical protein
VSPSIRTGKDHGDHHKRRAIVKKIKGHDNQLLPPFTQECVIERTAD